MRDLLRRIVLGAALPALAVAQDPTDWWAYRPLARPAPPAVAHADWVQNPIDAFVLAGLEQRGLQPVPPADAYTLLRRVTYDLTGLPPTEAEIRAFVADPSDAAYERVVDRLLASPQYGIKWARHWLDLVRFAETDGYERDRTKPFVHRYRDWVVDAFNQDLPYAEFVTKQLAGDELPEPQVADLIATGYYRLGIWDDEPTDKEQHRYDDLDGIADTTARALLGISMGCARCHDHKKDPLSQKEYYSFLAWFENVRPYDNRARHVPEDGEQQRYTTGLSDYENGLALLGGRLATRAAACWAKLDEPRRQRETKAADADLVARYSCETTTATELRDDLGVHPGAITGQAVPVTGRGGKGTGLRFDGDDFVELPRLVENSFSVSFFVRSNQRGAGDPSNLMWYAGTGLVDGEMPGVVADWGIAWHSDGRVVAGIGGPDVALASAPGNDDGKWHHVALTRDSVSGAAVLYVDGHRAADAVARTGPLDAPEHLVVGRSQPGGRGFQGELDDLCFFGSALTQAEVTALALDLPGGVRAPSLLADATAADDHAACAADFAGYAALRRPTLATTEVLAVEEAGPVGPPGFVRLRGNVHAQGAEVTPGVPHMAHGPAVQAPVARASSSGRRYALARWIVDAENPLTWRVLANRLWQHHFGRGLCRTSNDFGRLGDLPTHPELLDWLACEARQRGGSWKAMHKLLVTSATYRMATSASPAGLAADPLNDAFWRFDRRRLTAEELRDSVLAVSGDLNLQMGGPSVFPPLPAAVLATSSRPEEAWGTSPPDQAARRSIYVHCKRSLQEPLLAVFDQADTDSSCPVRFATVQPTQALVLWNGEFAQAQARALAARLTREAEGLPAQLARGLELVTQRPVREPDLARLRTLADDLERDFGRTEREALERCCLVLLNCNEFAYLD